MRSTRNGSHLPAKTLTVVFTKDFAVRHVPNERSAIVQHGVAVFMIRNARGEQMASELCLALPTVRRVLRAHAPAVIGRIVPLDGSVILHIASGLALEPKRVVKRPRGE